MTKLVDLGLCRGDPKLYTGYTARAAQYGSFNRVWVRIVLPVIASQF